MNGINPKQTIRYKLKWKKKNNKAHKSKVKATRQIKYIAP